MVLTKCSLLRVPRHASQKNRGVKKLAAKLTNLKLTSVDLVRAGANQEADICLFKSLSAGRIITPDDPNRFDIIIERGNGHTRP